MTELRKTNLPVIAVMARNYNNGIGFAGSIPWKCKLDMQIFRIVSRNSLMIMGRKTLESFPKPLTSLDRYNVCITRQKGADLDVLKAKYPNVLFTDSTDIDNIEVLAFDFFNDFENGGVSMPNVSKICVIGGVDILELFREDISTLFLSQIKDQNICDKYLDEISSYGELTLSQTPAFLAHTNYERLEIYAKDIPEPLKEFDTQASRIVFDITLELKNFLDNWHFTIGV